MAPSPAALPPHPTLGALLADRDLRLRLVTAPADDALARPLRWVHASDLPDPTPFLADDLALLTTGTQFARRGPAEQLAYVRRLADRGIAGLGFGVEVALPEIPAPLQEACAEAGIPLFEVPYRTPFIAVARAHAEAIAAHAFGRRSWALQTQRTLALAALRPQGLDAMLAELAGRLGCWVGMIDGTGAVVSEHPAGAIAPETAAEIGGRAQAIIARGQHTAQSLTLGAEACTLFSLGRGSRLGGVIAIGTAALDAEARDVVTAVIAMAGLALDQGEELRARERRLRSRVLAALRAGDEALARDVLGRLPEEPVVVAVTEPGATADALDSWWERAGVALAAPSAVASGSDAGYTVCLSARHAGLIDDAAGQLGIRFGVSAPTTLDRFAHAEDQASAALRRGTAPVTHFAEMAGASVFTALSSDDARLIAAARLEPLRTAGADLERCLRVWLSHDARVEAAASELGIHRHTLRARIAQASQLLGTDLSTFPARAELWAALLAATP